MRKNVTEFYVVGKTKTTREFRLAHFTSKPKGWKQVCIGSDKSYDFEYVSEEDVPQLMEWFKLDFTQYRMFDDLSEALAYKEMKIA